MMRTTCLMLVSVLGAAQTSDKVNHGSAVIKDFLDRVGNYVKVHKAAQAEVHRLKPTNSAEEIKAYELAFAEQIRAARQGAVQGSIFTPEIVKEFRRLIHMTMQGSKAVRIQESMKRAAPVGTLALRVNGAYPSTLPLQSTPPSLLLNLPPLPPDVEYRVVGHDLLLRDVDANLIVDFARNVIP